jgi:hypothetical protein
MDFPVLTRLGVEGRGGLVKKSIALALSCAAFGLVIVSGSLASAQPPASDLPLPLRLSAWAVNMSNIAPGRNAVMDINITRWTMPKEREALITTVLEKGPSALLRELQKMPSHGRMRIPGWQGPDPHNVRLGWDLHYAWQVPQPEGGHRIVIATDRYIGFWEARNQPRSIDYPFTLLELRIRKDGEGEGKMAAAAKISFDKKKNQIELENYASEPVRLNQVKVEGK